MGFRKLIVGLLLTLFFSVSNAAVYYVAPDGNDSNPGTIELPWATWGRAFNATLSPGDTVYFRGGTYIREFDGDPSWYSTYWHGYQSTLDGTADNYIHFFAYPGETPVLDGTGTYVVGEQKNTGLILHSSSSYLHLKGLTIKSIEQVTAVQEDVSGLQVLGSKHIIEQMTVYDIDGVGIRMAPTGVNDTLWIINSDAYFCSDSLGDQYEQPSNPRPGDDGTGIVHTGSTDSTNVVISRGNRAWACGDQGFTSGGIGTMIMDSCWSFLNGQLMGGGHGVKTGWFRHYDKITNSIFIGNKGEGLTTNEDYLAQGGTVCADSLIVFNSLFYANDQGIRIDAYPDDCDNPALNELNRVFRNNIVYDNVDADVYPTYGATYTHEYNSFDITGLTVTDADFLALTKDSVTLISVLGAARNSDGSLPDIGDYFQLAPASPMVDAGIDLGYGDDLGAFQYTAYTPPIDPPESSSRRFGRTRDERWAITRNGNWVKYR